MQASHLIKSIMPICHTCGTKLREASWIDIDLDFEDEPIDNTEYSTCNCEFTMCRDCRGAMKKRFFEWTRGGLTCGACRFEHKTGQPGSYPRPTTDAARQAQNDLFKNHAAMQALNEARMEKFQEEQEVIRLEILERERQEKEAAERQRQEAQERREKEAARRKQEAEDREREEQEYWAAVYRQANVEMKKNKLSQAERKRLQRAQNQMK